MRFFQGHRPRKILAILALGLGLAAAGCHRHGTPEEKVTHAKGWIADELELTADQTAKLDKVGEAVVSAMKDMKAQRDADFEVLLKQVEGSMSKDVLVDLANQRIDGIKEKVPGLAERLVEFHASLNPEQKAQVTKWMRRIHERRSRS